MSDAHSNPAGEVLIRIQRSASAARRFSVRSIRPTHAARVFEGRSLADTVDALPRLYNICGGVQAVAALDACEAAAGISAADGVQRARRMLLRVEAIREHLWRLLIDWPQALGLPANPAPVAMAMQADAKLRAAITGALRFDADKVGPVPDVISGLEEIAASHLFGKSASAWLDDRDSVALAVMERRIHELGWQDLGRTAVSPMPADIDLNLWDQRMSAPDADDFAAEPAFDASHHETGTLARQPTTNGSAGLIERWHARLTELALLLTDATHMTERSMSPTDGTGIASAEAARGTLVHRVRQQGGMVARYQIVAPTEWNFHPGGPLARALATVDESDRAPLAAQTRALVTAIDPCVAWRIEWVNGHA